MIRILLAIIAIQLSACAAYVRPELRTNGQDVNPAEVWEIVSDFEDCVGQRVPSGATIEIVTGWHVSECSGAQVWACAALPAPDPTERCPKLCAGMARRSPPHVYVTPNLAALPHELVHLLGISDHAHPLFDTCGATYRP